MPGDCVSADHYISTVACRLPNTFGRERQGHCCGTLFVDLANGMIFYFCQFSTAASETVRSKRQLESFASEEGFEIKPYHLDNCIFFSSKLMRDCKVQH